jgi:D-serine deaminase-like pyridoxal phosphate-dependent protein
MNNSWYHIENIHELDSPALVLYPQRIQHNINLAISITGDVHRLRPHIKTHKIKEIVQLMMAAGIYKYKCATIAEAELLGMCGAPDVLLAYQPIGPKLQRFVQLTQQYPQTRFACVTDNTASAAAIGHAFAAAGGAIAAYLDINIGQNRTGIAPGDAAIHLYNYCAQVSGLAITGLHAYDGHIQGADLAARTALCHETFAPVQKMKQQLQATGHPQVTIIAGGTPTFPIHAQRQDVECSPGTFVLWDKSYLDQCPEQAFEVAALLVTRVISLPNATRICVDLGHKSVAAENALPKRVFFPQAPALEAVSQSEEHLVLEAGAGHSFQPGDVLYGIPQHICPTVALYERACIVEHGKVTGEWRVLARDRKISL